MRSKLFKVLFSNAVLGFPLLTFPMFSFAILPIPIHTYPPLVWMIKSWKQNLGILPLHLV